MSHVVKHVNCATTFFLRRQVLQHLPVSFKRGSELSIFTLEIHHVSLSCVLFLFAALKICLSFLNFLFDICQKQILIQGMNFSDIAISSSCWLSYLSGILPERFHQGCLRPSHLISWLLLHLSSRRLRHHWTLLLLLEVLLIIGNLLEYLLVLLLDPIILLQHLSVFLD